MAASCDQEDLELLKTGLAHTATLCSHQPDWTPALLGRPLLQLLALDRPFVRPEVRRWVFTIVQNSLAGAVGNAQVRCGYVGPLAGM